MRSYRSIYKKKLCDVSGQASTLNFFGENLTKKARIMFNLPVSAYVGVFASYPRTCIHFYRSYVEWRGADQREPGAVVFVSKP